MDRQLKNIFKKIETKLSYIITKLDEQKTTDNDINGYYTSTEVRALLRISINKLTQIREAGLIEYLKLSNNSYRYPKNQPIFQGYKAA